MKAYVVGERQYKTDGYAMMVESADETEKKCAAGCEPVANQTLEFHSGKRPIFTLSAEYLRQALDHIVEKNVSFFFEADDKPVLLWSEGSRFSIVMPIYMRHTEINLPKPTKASAEKPPQPPAATDLLAACESALEEIRRLDDNDAYPSIPVFDTLRAAIAKAKGQP